MKSKLHFHLDENGQLVKCYHQARSALTSFGFWLGLTLGFPIEHYLWEKVWPFYKLTEILGL